MLQEVYHTTVNSLITLFAQVLDEVLELVLVPKGVDVHLWGHIFLGRPPH